MKHFLVSLLAFISLITIGFGQEKTAFFNQVDGFFKTYVKDGLVDYKTLKAQPETLDGLLEMAKHYEVDKSDAEVYQAFWINVYNLAVIKGVVTHYPIDSPLKVDGFFDKITYALGGRQISLNTIEHELLRKNFPEEARFHFVLVCAGLGCPPLISSAYFPQRLDMQLTDQTKSALNDPNFIRITDKEVKLSQLFEWFKEDFTQGQTEIEFINTYRKEPIPNTIAIGYYNYNWQLNEIK